ncbi:hypothetical protein ACPZ19_04770 [Amycolatopsis lurida]
MPRRRRWWLLAVAVALAAVVAFGNYALIAGQDERVDVLVLTRAVGWGEPIDDGDLAVAKAVPDQPLASIPARDRAGVLGLIARASLSAGSVLAPDQLTAQPVPGPGERLVGLPVGAGRFPARGLLPGDLVHVSPVASGTVTGTGPAPASPASAGPFRARVLGVGPPDSSGAVTVDVVVGADAAQVATSAAAGQVVIVQLGPNL